MSIFEHHNKHDEKHEDKHEDKHNQTPENPAHPPQANQPPEQRADVQPLASTLTVTDPEVLRNRFFLLWGA